MTTEKHSKGASKPVLDFRKAAVYPLEKGDVKMKAAIVDLRPREGAYKFPFAAVLWNAEKDNFGVALPNLEEGWERHLKDQRSDSKNFSVVVKGSKTAGNFIFHRLRVHFFHEGYPTVEDSGAFFGPKDLFQEVPQLAGRDIKFSADNNRVIENLTHDQALSLLRAFIAVNTAAQEKQEIDRARDEKVGALLSNALAPK